VLPLNQEPTSLSAVGSFVINSINSSDPERIERTLTKLLKMVHRKNERPILTWGIRYDKFDLEAPGKCE
jgi:hypothetical protein